MVRILSLDGGGVMISSILERIYDDSFDLIAGTSTGGILALGLGFGIPAGELTSFYCNTKIFDDNDLGGLIGAKYYNRELKRELIARFGDKTLSDLKTRVLVTTFDLEGWEPLFVDSSDPSFTNLRLVDLAMMTSAALPSYGKYVDGANDPALVALAYCGVGLGDVEMLTSIGSGRTGHGIRGLDLDWGDAQWVSPLIKLLLDANVSVAEKLCSKWLGDRYRRINPVTPNIALDDTSRIMDLIEIGRTCDTGQRLS